MSAAQRQSFQRQAIACAVFALVGLALGCSSHRKLVALDPEVSEDEVLAAGDSAGAPELTGPLVHILEHRGEYDTGVVVAALIALGQRGDAEAVTAIAALRSDPSEEVRWHCVRALKEIGDESARAALQGFATDPSPLIRDEALENS